ncbi:DNRLRE domain-containing protein [Planobispora rosea]|uniref:DNRLRE domain-containing protein n=1 Tax=Planobispora rosea TaxID=35762 RepID=UPI00083A0FA6|nr:DNRLRE domain-containing protein [Planobispora rosea]
MPIDTTLVEQNGVLKPKAIASDVAVAIANGGAGAFVSMAAVDGQSYALKWPTALPKPTISKNTATFADAAGKGADLVVTVLPTGFRHDVVLRERPAKPLEIRIGVQASGLSLSEGKGGRLLLTRGKGKKLVASAPQPVMWDAGAKASQAEDRLAKGGSPKARHAKVATDVVVKDGRTELVLKPDHAFLTDPATTYPVRVDPTTTLPFNNDVEVADSSDADWPADPTAWYLTAGRMHGSLSRVYLRFDTAGLAGQTVSDAKLSLLNIDAQGCGTAVGPGIQVRRVTAAWDENNLHWGNKPAATTEDAATNTKAFGQSCTQGVAPLEWNVTGIAQDWANGAANHGLMLRHPNEANTADNYRVFPSAEETSDFNRPPTLTVTTSGPASAPQVSGLAITPAQSTDGTTTATSLTPQLAATVSDVIGGNLSGEFEIEHDPAATGQGTGQIWAGASTAVASGSPAAVTVPAGKLADGWKVRWRARAVNAAASSTSAWSAWQQATIDVPNPTVGAFQVTPAQQVDGATVTTSLTPALHTTVTDPVGQPLRAEFEVEHDPAATGQGSGQVWTGAVDNVASGTQASVTVPVNTLTDGWKIRWRTRAINTVTALGSPWSDWQTLTVDAPDPVSEPTVGALQVTPSQQVDGTTVTPTRTPSLLAQVNDPAGSALRAEVEVEHDPAAPTGQGSGQIWTGSADNVLAGTQATIAVPTDTLADEWKVRWRARAVSSTAASAWSDWQSFTVSLPKPTATGLTITPSKVVDGTTVSTTLTPTLQAALTHPTGQTLRAEVEVEHDPAAPEGQGSGQIWTGSVDNVASGTQASIPVPAATLTDGWKVRWRRRAVADQATSAWSDWQQVTIDVTQPGEEPLAQTAGPVIRTDQSFTTAAWLRWSDKDGAYSVIEQKGVHQASFRLGNTPDHGLMFTFTSSDAADATIEGVLSDVEPPVNEWFHLAGVYDAAAKTASLYLNGALIKTTPVSFTVWNADTVMALGSKMKGDLDEVQIYQRSFDAGEITALLTSPAAQGSRTLKENTLSAPTMSAAAAQAGGFDYEHPKLQDCTVSGRETGYAEYDARISEKPYSSCWSAYLYIKDYEEDDSTGRMKKAPCNRAGGIIKWACSQIEEPFDDDYAFRFRATWVIHSYLGDSTGNSVVNGAGSGIKPTDMKIFIQLDEFAVLDENGKVVIPASELRNLPISLEMYADTKPFSDGDCEPDDDRKTKDVSAWVSKPDETFKINATVDAKSTFICTVAPHVRFDVEGLADPALRLWSDKALDDDGKVVGIRRHGKGQPHLRSWVPNFRCDSLTFGAGDEAVADRVGGCINTRAKRVFVMSKSDDRAFIEVIEHIEDALNPNNSRTFPYLRPGHDWSKPSYPPTRKILGNEQNKFIYGNWAAPRYDEDGDDAAGKPLTRGIAEKSETANYNRKFFSRIEMHMDIGTREEMNWLLPPALTSPPSSAQEVADREKARERHSWSINYCKYYMPEKYPAPYRPDKLPMGKLNTCDEYPFASTLQGAGYAQGNFSVRALNGKQNNLQGTELKKFYADFRVGEGNPFWVLIAP